MIRKTALALLLALLALPEGALALAAHENDLGVADRGRTDWLASRQPTVELERPRRALADPDADGRVTSAEAAGFFSSHFASLDRDADGRLQERDLLRLAVGYGPASKERAEPRRPSFQELDRNDDGRLSQEEFRQRRVVKATRWTRHRLARLFANLDDDSDGIVDRERFMSTGRGYHSRCSRADGHAPVGRFLAGMPF